MQLHPSLRIGPFRYLIGNISPVALNLMLDQWKIIVQTSTCLQACTRIFGATIEMPCKHANQHSMFNPNQPLRPEHVHVQWHLDGESLRVVEPIPRLLVQKSMKVRSKRWPNNSHDTSTKKNPSQFEIAEGVARQRQRCQQMKEDNRQDDDEQAQSQRRERRQGQR